jgi:hypothetical protein
MHLPPEHPSPVRIVPIAGTDEGYTAVTTDAVAHVGPGDRVAQAVVAQLVRDVACTTPRPARLVQLLSGPSGLWYPSVVAAFAGSSGIDVVVHHGTAVASGVRHLDGSATAAVVWSNLPGDGPLHVSVAGLAALTTGVDTDAPALDRDLSDLRAGTIRSGGFVATWPTNQQPSVPSWLHRAPVGPPTPHPCVRPPVVAVLRFDSGDAYEIRGELLIGRQGPRTAVPQGDVSGLSRIHAGVRVCDGRILVTDHHSRNGTFRWDRATHRWNRLPSGVATAISSGDALAFGWRTAVVHPSPSGIAGTPRPVHETQEENP